MGRAEIGDTPRSSRIVAVGNLKGGTGKSTIAVNIACKLATWHDAVLLADADPQGTASAWLEGGRSPDTPTSLRVEAPPTGPIDHDWARHLHGLRDRFDRIVIDLPPQFGPGFEAILHLVDAIVIPVTPSAIDLRATSKTLQVIQRVRQSRNGSPACMLIPNKVDQRTAFGRNIRSQLKALGYEVGPVVAQRSQQTLAFAARRWIGAFAPGTAAAREMAVVATELDRVLSACPASDYRVKLPPLPEEEGGRSPKSAMRVARPMTSEPRNGFLEALFGRFRRASRPITS